jgi:Domain of unknown function (DUF1854)
MLQVIPLQAFGSQVTVRDLIESRTGLRLRWGNDGRLWAIRHEQRQPVTIHRCFPWSAPQRMFSLRDGDGNEVALVRDTSTLDSESRGVLEEALAIAGFVLTIERVHRIVEEIEVRCWHVATSQGPRSFQTGRDDWPRELPGGGLLLRDVAGDLYHIPEPNRLDPHSRKLLWAFVD